MMLLAPPALPVALEGVGGGAVLAGSVLALLALVAPVGLSLLLSPSTIRSLPRPRRSRPAALAEVVEAALGEVREHRRIDVLHVDELLLHRDVAGDLARVLAELLEHATASSPPLTTVQLAGEVASSGYVLQIEDHGGTGDLGLGLVAGLMARHGISARLRPSWSGGVTALVLLPNDCIVAGKPGSNGRLDRIG